MPSRTLNLPLLVLGQKGCVYVPVQNSRTRCFSERHVSWRYNAAGWWYALSPPLSSLSLPHNALRLPVATIPNINFPKSLVRCLICGHEKLNHIYCLLSWISMDHYHTNDTDVAADFAKNKFLDLIHPLVLRLTREALVFH